MLYQLVVGEFRKAMSAGWERDIKDELLRECIADAAQGDITHRLGDAASLANRLRTLEEERARRQRQQAARQKAEELERALAAAKSSQAVAEFLSKDMFSVVGARPLRELTVQELLEAASAKLANRFEDMPLASAQIHAALGSAFWTMELMEDAKRHLGEALSQFEQLGMSGSDLAAPTAGQLMTVEFALGDKVDVSRYQGILEQCQARLGLAHPQVLALRQQIAWMRFCLGDWRQAAEELRQLKEQVEAGAVPGPTLGLSALQLGRVLVSLGEFDEALRTLDEGRERLVADFGASHLSVAQLDTVKAQALVHLERFEEAEPLVDQAEQSIRRWAPSDVSAQLVSVQYVRGQLRQRQGRHEDAMRILGQVVDSLDSTGWALRSGFISEIQMWLARSHFDANRIEEAAALMRTALATSESICGAPHPQSQQARIGLAEIECRRLGPAEACASLKGVPPAALSRLGTNHPLVAEQHRVEALIAGAQGQFEKARLELREALRIYEAGLGRDHSFTASARAELARTQARRVKTKAGLRQ
jgi:non-specific serine/threonine protein kinase